jgi:hypothetical protein
MTTRGGGFVIRLAERCGQEAPAPIAQKAHPRAADGARQAAEAVTQKTRPGVPRRPGLATRTVNPQTVLDRDAHYSRCGVILRFDLSGIFSELLP